MKKHISHIEQLEQFNKERFASWLRSGFEDLVHEDREITAFAPLHYFIGYHDNIIDDLKAIYDELSGTAKENFRLGVKIAFSGFPPENQYASLIRLFLHLAGKIHAVEILPEIVKQVGNGYFGIPQNNEGHELFALSLDIVSGMAPYLDIGNVVRQLVGSRFFSPDYAPMVFIALCRTEPDHFPDHFKFLRSDFSILHKNRGTHGAYLTAIRFVQYVDLATISQNLWLLYLTMHPNITIKTNSDNWFGEALFVGEKAPLILTKENHFYIQRTSGQYEKKYKVIIPHTDTSANQSHDNDVRKFLNYIVGITQKKELHSVMNEPDIEEICNIKKKLSLSLNNISGRHSLPYPKNINTEASL